MPDQVHALGLTRNKQTRRTFNPGARGAREGVGAARARGDERAAEFVGKFAVGLGRKRATLLVQTSDVAQLRAFTDRVDKVHATAARQQKEVLKVVRRLADEGSIVIATGGDEAMV
jgi:GGDEF domain-containing protein